MPFQRFLRRDSGVAALIFLTFVLVYGIFSRLGIDMHHDGIMLKPALDVASGQSLFRETFTQYGPLSTYLQAFAILILGPKLLSLRIATTLAYGAAASFFYLAWRCFLSVRLSLVAIWGWFLFAPFFSGSWNFMPWSSAFGLVFQALALWLFLRAGWDQDPKRRPLLHFAGAGAAIALAFLSRQPVGFLSGISLLPVVFVWPHPAQGRWKPTGAYLGGAVSVVAAYVAFLASRGDLSEAFYQTVTWPARWSSDYASSPLNVIGNLFPYRDTRIALLVTLGLVFLPTALKNREKIGARARIGWTLGALGFTVAALARIPLTGMTLLQMSTGGWASVVPFSALVFGVALALRKWNAGSAIPGPQRAVIASAALGAASWAQYFPVPCQLHIFWSIGPAFGAFVLLFHSYLKSTPRWTAATLLLLFAPALIERLEQGSVKLQAADTPMPQESVLSGIWAARSEVEVYTQSWDAVREYESQHSDTPILTHGPHALFNGFAANLANPGPIYVVWPGLLRDTDERARERFILEKQPIVLFEEVEFKHRDIDGFMRKFGYGIWKRIPGLDQVYLVQKQGANTLTPGRPTSYNQSAPDIPVNR